MKVRWFSKYTKSDKHIGMITFGEVIENFTCDPGDDVSTKWSTVFFFIWSTIWSIYMGSHNPPCAKPENHFVHPKDDYCFSGKLYSPDFLDPGLYKERPPLYYITCTNLFLAAYFLINLVPKYLWKKRQPGLNDHIEYFCEEAEDIERNPLRMMIRTVMMAVRIDADIRMADNPDMGISMIIEFVGMKLVYCLNAVCQFIALAHFMGSEKNFFWGGSILLRMVAELPWQTVPMFPRDAFCVFTNGTQTFAVECDLRFNEINEKLFVILWFWISCQVFMVVTNALITFYRLFSPRFIYSLLWELHNRANPNLARDIKLFAETYLTFEEQLVLVFVYDKSADVARLTALKLFSIFQYRIRGRRV